MLYKTLGRTGLKVSVLGFGGAPMGLAYYLAPDDTSAPAVQAKFIDAVERAVELGINYFDTAPGYGNGVGESVMGRALARHRDGVVLASKCPQDATADGLEASVNDSLRRLGTDRIDVMQFHGGMYDRADAERIVSGGLLERLERMRDAGKIRFIGVTAEVPSAALEWMVETGRFDVLQVCYNLVSQGSADHSRACRGIAAVAERHAMGIASMRTTTCGFIQRLLAAEFPEAATAERVTRIAIEFVLSTPEIDVALVGMRDRREVEANAAIAADAGARYDLEALNDRYLDLKDRKS